MVPLFRRTTIESIESIENKDLVLYFNNFYIENLRTEIQYTFGEFTTIAYNLKYDIKP